MVKDEHNAYKNKKYTCPVCNEEHDEQSIKETTWWLVIFIDGHVEDICNDCFHEHLSSGAIMRCDNYTASDYKFS